MRIEAQTNRFVDPKKHVLHRFSTVDAFLEVSEIKNGVNTVWHNDLPIDFHFKKADSKVLLIESA